MDKKTLLFIFSVSYILLSEVHAQSVNLLQFGIVGDVTTRILVENLTDKESIIFGTSTGVYIFSSTGKLEKYIQTSSSVNNIDVVNDINNDGKKDIIITTKDVYFPNIQLYDTDGKKLWEFSSKTEVYDVYILWTMHQTPVFDLSVMNDTNGNGYDDIVISSGYSVILLDSKNGDEIWRFEDSDNVWDIEIVKDINNDNYDDILVGDQNGYIILLNGKTGKKIWDMPLVKSYKVINPSTNSMRGIVKRNVWDILLNEKDEREVIVSGEDGYVYSIDLENKKIKWKKEIIDYSDILLYQYYGDYPLPTSSMDYNFFNLKIEFVPDVTGDGESDVIASTFPGKRLGNEYKGVKGLYLLDISNGEIVWKNENLELSYTQELKPMKIGNKNCLLLPVGKYSSQEKIKVVDLKDGSIYKTISINSSSGPHGQYRLEKFGKNKFLIISTYSDLILSDFLGNIEWNYPRMNDLSVEIADLVGDSSQDLFIKSRNNADLENPFDEGQSRILFVLDGKTREIAWSYEMPFEEFTITGGLYEVKLTPDLNGDEKKDVVAYVQYPGEWEWGDTIGNKTRIIVFSGKDGKILMNRSVVEQTYYGIYEDFYDDFNQSVFRKVLEEWGMKEEEISKLPSDTKDEFYRQVEEKMGEYAKRRAELLIRKRIESIDVMNDVSGDGVADFIIGGWKDVFILDPVSGKIVWNRTYDAWVYEDPYTGKRPTWLEWNWTTHSDRNRLLTLGDINNDGIDDMALISWSDVMILQSVKNENGFDYRRAHTIKPLNGLNKEKCTTIDDINGDDVKEIVLEKHVRDAPSRFEIISGKDGSILLEFEKKRGTYRLGVTDFNNDSYNDSIIFYTWTETGPRLDVVNGRNSEVIWNYHGIDEPWMLENFFGYEMFMPATPIEDMNGDGVDELAVVRSLPWHPGAEILIYDIMNDELIKKITLEKIDEMMGGERKWSPGIYAKLLPDFTDDSVKEIGVIVALGDIHQKEIKFMVVDVVNNEIVNDFKILGNQIIKFGDLVGIISRGGGLYFLEVGKDLEIISPKNEEVVESPLKIEWRSGKKESVNMIYVDGKKILRTTENSAVFDIREGNHTITVRSLDPYGKGMYDEVNVNVVKDSSMIRILFMVIAVLLCILLLPKLLRIWGSF